MIGYHRFHVFWSNKWTKKPSDASRVASCILGNCWAPPRCFEICFVSRAASCFWAWPWWIQSCIKDIAPPLIFQQHLQTGEACEIYSSIPPSCWLQWRGTTLLLKEFHKLFTFAIVAKYVLVVLYMDGRTIFHLWLYLWMSIWWRTLMQGIHVWLGIVAPDGKLPKPNRSYQMKT